MILDVLGCAVLVNALTSSYGRASGFKEGYLDAQAAKAKAKATKARNATADAAETEKGGNN